MALGDSVAYGTGGSVTWVGVGTGGSFSTGGSEVEVEVEVAGAGTAVTVTVVVTVPAGTVIGCTGDDGMAGGAAVVRGGRAA